MAKRIQNPRSAASLTTQIIRAVVTLGKAYAPHMRGILLALAVVIAAATGRTLPIDAAVREFRRLPTSESQGGRIAPQPGGMEADTARAPPVARELSRISEKGRRTGAAPSFIMQHLTAITPW